MNIKNLRVTILCFVQSLFRISWWTDPCIYYIYFRSWSNSRKKRTEYTACSSNLWTQVMLLRLFIKSDWIFICYINSLLSEVFNQCTLSAATRLNLSMKCWVIKKWFLHIYYLQLIIFGFNCLITKSNQNTVSVTTWRRLLHFSQVSLPGTLVSDRLSQSQSKIFIVPHSVFLRNN